MRRAQSSVGAGQWPGRAVGWASNSEDPRVRALLVYRISSRVFEHDCVPLTGSRAMERCGEQVAGHTSTRRERVHGVCMAVCARSAWETEMAGSGCEAAGQGGAACQESEPSGGHVAPRPVAESRNTAVPAPGVPAGGGARVNTGRCFRATRCVSQGSCVLGVRSGPSKEGALTSRAPVRVLQGRGQLPITGESVELVTALRCGTRSPPARPTSRVTRMEGKRLLSSRSVAPCPEMRTGGGTARNVSSSLIT